MKTPYQETVDNQIAAADPARSAFVSANAGAGKTRVLTNRVARLLLAGAEPQRILCITYTKAAAAEMASRLFDLLGEWAFMSDDKLRATLNELDGASHRRTTDDLARARRLFARALETPGGLKIQTIHSFCESVLRRFPLEAGAPPGFTVIEERDALALKEQAVDFVARMSDGDIQAALSTLGAHHAGEALRALLISQIAKGVASTSPAHFRREFAGLLDIAPDLNAETVVADLLDNVSDAELERLQASLLAGEVTATKKSAKIGEYLGAAERTTKYALFLEIFLNKDGTKPSGNSADITDAKVRKADPGAKALAANFRDAAYEARRQVVAIETLDRSCALYAISTAARARYAQLKAARAVLDFDDLIAMTRALFANRERLQWVMYKLDQGLEHILLDEAQDTSPDAWEVIEGPLDEFLAGAGARDALRTFFAVGDQKQSIYSFQGADAALFQAKAHDLGARIEKATPFKNVPLHLSFRTVAPILEFVDELFADATVLEGVGDEQQPLRHTLFREGHGGLVELWPLAPTPEKGEVKPWDAPIKSTSGESAAAKLTAAVAETIKTLIASGDVLESRGRAVRPDDFLILVQSRGNLYHAMNAALARANIPAAGADRIKLLDDQGVSDLLSYARAVAFDGDDLALAETLKTPFFGLDDDALFDLAWNRSGTLWRALRDRCDENFSWARAVDEISVARKVADMEGAYAFFNAVLENGEPSGWKRMGARLGRTSREPVEEFLRQALDYEEKHPRSLRGFISYILKSAGEVSREVGDANGAARVMTVHKAKGLEAPIVILLDAHRESPSSRDLLVLENGYSVSTTTDDRSPALEAARTRRKLLAREEYRRLLYVAATRAEDRLYICGHEHGRNKNPHKKPPAEKSWHALAEDAFDRLGGKLLTTSETRWGKPVRRYIEPQTTAPDADDPEQAVAGPALPDVLSNRARNETAVQRVSPSQLADRSEAIANTIEMEHAAFSPVVSRDRFFRGNVLHKLFELLPDIALEKRDEAARRLLEKLAPDIAPEERDRWRAEVLTVLNDSIFADVFGPDSRAEAPIGGRPAGISADVIISGQIDRLVVTETRVLAVDYKTNRPPPKRVEDTPLAYLSQMAAYCALLRDIFPGRDIEMALLWTFEARLTVLPEKLLDQAFARTLA